MVIETEGVKHYATNKPCKYCGAVAAEKYKRQEIAGGNVFIRTECSECGKFKQWAKQVVDDEIWPL